MAKIDVAATIQETDELLKRKDSLLQEIADNRFLLRAAVRSGNASKEQKEWIEETFPEQKTKTPEERVQAAKDRLADVEKKAKEKAAKENSSKTTTRAAA